MGKIRCKIGYAISNEVDVGIWKDSIVEKSYCGDTSRSYINSQASDGINDNVTIANDISIIADIYTKKNFHSMQYVKLDGVKWKISKVEPKYPRLFLTLGGLYNEQS